MKSNAQIILRSLQAGNRLPYGSNGHIVTIYEGKFGIVGTQIEDGEESEVLLGLNDFSFQDFLDWCETFTEEQVVTMVANKVLCDINTKERL